MKKGFSVWRKNAPVWIAAAGTLGILAVVVVILNYIGSKLLVFRKK